MRNVGGRGLGVFSLSGILKGSRVVRFYGKPRWIWDIPRWEWDHLYQIDYDRYLVPSAGSFGWSINHSCSPNCAVHGERDLVAIRNIAAGEELTFDYSTNVGWDGYLMVCSCGSKACRGTVTSYQRLGGEWKERYRGMVSPFLLKAPRSVRPTLF